MGYYTDKWIEKVVLPTSPDDKEYWVKVNVKLTTSEIRRLRSAEATNPGTDAMNRVAGFLVPLVDSWNIDEAEPARDGFGPDSEGQALYEAAVADWKARDGILPINATTLDLLDHTDTKVILDRVTAGRRPRDPKEQTDF